jgi:hypothetical protein
LLEQIGGLGFVVEFASLVFLDLDADQIAANVVALRQPMQAHLTRQELLRNLALEGDRVGAVS